VPVAQRAGTTRRQTEDEPAARLARWAPRAVITVTALGMALAACSNSSDPAGNVGSGPATGDATTPAGSARSAAISPPNRGANHSGPRCTTWAPIPPRRTRQGTARTASGARHTTEAPSAGQEPARASTQARIEEEPWISGST
jgi:hypothetical protein